MQLPDYASALDTIEPAALQQHVPAAVAAAIAGREIVAFKVPDDASDTAACSARFGIPLDDCANTIVLKYKRDGQERYAAVVTLGSRRLDVNGAVKRALGAQRLSFAAREAAVEHSAMEYGGITAFGLPPDWVVLVDAAVLAREWITMGAGRREAKLLLRPATLMHAEHVTSAELTL